MIRRKATVCGYSLLVSGYRQWTCHRIERPRSESYAPAKIDPKTNVSKAGTHPHITLAPGRQWTSAGDGWEAVTGKDELVGGNVIHTVVVFQQVSFLVASSNTRAQLFRRVVRQDGQANVTTITKREFTSSPPNRIWEAVEDRCSFQLPIRIN